MYSQDTGESGWRQSEMISSCITRYRKTVQRETDRQRDRKSVNATVRY